MRQLTPCLLLSLLQAAAVVAAPARPAAKPTAPAVKGTTQLAGDNGKLGITYTVGAGEQAINFTLESAEFRVSRLNMGNVVMAPHADEKLLVLNFTAHNPNKSDLLFNGANLEFIAVDAQDVNHEDEDFLIRAGTEQALETDLKPAQKISATAAVRVPAKGPIPKLIVRAPSSERVMRYDLRGQVKGLAAPFADAADAGGVTARTEVPGQPGTAYPTGRWDLKFVSAAMSSSTLANVEPEDGKRLLVVTFEATNQGLERADYTGGTFVGRLTLADGEEVECVQTLVKAASNADATGQASRGQAIALRMLFQVGKETAAKKLVLSESSDAAMRGYAFDVSGVK